VFFFLFREILSFSSDEIFLRDLPQQKKPRGLWCWGSSPQFYMFPRSHVRIFLFYKMRKYKESCYVKGGSCTRALSRVRERPWAHPLGCTSLRRMHSHRNLHYNNFTLKWQWYETKKFTKQKLNGNVMGAHWEHNENTLLGMRENVNSNEKEKDQTREHSSICHPSQKLHASTNTFLFLSKHRLRKRRWFRFRVKPKHWKWWNACQS
jgi:hypothetical protein